MCDTPQNTAATSFSNTHSPAASGSAASAAGKSTSDTSSFHKLSNKWTLWAHLPHDTDWTVNSYKNIYEFDTAEEAITITEMLPEKLVINCMLFIMRSGIMPIWEDPQNRNGGCFSYKVANKDVHVAWKQLTYVLVGDTISTNASIIPVINGITISPKKNFCIIKIWLSNCKFNNASVIRELDGIRPHGCLFKKHMPEY